MLQNSSALIPPAPEKFSRGSELQSPCRRGMETGGNLGCQHGARQTPQPSCCPVLDSFIKPIISPMQLISVFSQGLESKLKTELILSLLCVPPSLPLAVQPKNNCKKQKKMFTQLTLCKKDRSSAAL